MDRENVDPVIELLPMAQRSEARGRKEDWTGKSSTALRRKLQNRLNQRASRKRRGLVSTSKTLSNDNPPASSTLEWVIVLDDSTRRATQSTNALISRPASNSKPPHPEICMHPINRRIVISASSFSEYTSTFARTPLPCDQKLLTLLHFNLVRALSQNVHLLGLDEDQMALDIESPFVSGVGGVELSKLPPNMRPTKLQRTVPHHPEIDVLPFPKYRDNAIIAGKEIDDYEICNDMLYGVDEDEEVGCETEKGVGCHREGSGGRTGLIVWSDPWLASSWEVEEGFARKYKRLLVGCNDLLESTNYWRETRGESPLVLDDD